MIFRLAFAVGLAGVWALLTGSVVVAQSQVYYGATAIASAGPSEGPTTVVRRGLNGAHATATFNNSVGTGFGEADVDGYHSKVHGEGTTTNDANFIGSGRGDWLRTMRVPFNASSLVGSPFNSFPQFTFHLSWNIVNNGGYRFSIFDQESSYSVSQGFFFNDFNLPFGNSGQMEVKIDGVFDAVVATETPNMFLGYLPMEFSARARGDSGISTIGNFSFAEGSAELVMEQEVDVLDGPGGGGGIVLDAESEYEEPVPNADFDGDLDVDGTDFLIWQQGLGIDEMAEHYQGDADYDQAVDSVDYDVWRAQYGTAPSGGATAVPEPGGAALVMMLAAGLRRRGRGVRKPVVELRSTTG
jgi:hypothetical protein